jgi:hypothetical protein
LKKFLKLWKNLRTFLRIVKKGLEEFGRWGSLKGKEVMKGVKTIVKDSLPQSFHLDLWLSLKWWDSWKKRSFAVMVSVGPSSASSQRLPPWSISPIWKEHQDLDITPW